jgi:hypothetical protein
MIVDMNKFDDYILKKRVEYYEIKTVKCRVLLDEEVVFNRHGLNHLVRKEGHNRTFVGQRRRFELLKYCKLVLENENSKIEYRISMAGDTKAEFWGITADIECLRVKVVLRKINEGKLIFLSVMDFK